MNTVKRKHSHSPNSRRYPYPNAADPAYFKERIKEGLTAMVGTMGTVTFFLYLATI